MNKYDKLTFKKTLLKQGIAFISGLSIVGSGMGLTEAIASTDTFVNVESSTTTINKVQPTPSSPIKVPKASPSVTPTPTTRKTQTKPRLQSPPTKPTQPKVSPKPSVSHTRQGSSPKVKLSAPKILDPQTSKNDPPETLKQVLSNPQKIQISPSATTRGTNSYIDTTTYKNPNQPVKTPNKVILTERSTGCKTIAQNGQLSQGNCGTVAVKKPTLKAPQKLTSRRVTLASRRQVTPSTSVRQPVKRVANVQPRRLKRRPIGQEQVISVQPFQRQGLSIALEPIPRYNRSASMYSNTVTQRGNTDLIFPLPMAARMTSAFGWRIHPIAGTRRMHNGTDFGAPLGTPVLAVYPGEVSQADWAGGYGLMVTLRHLEGTQESRYAHLSDIYVQPGEWVEQGAVIGRLGNTGYSTGPHLHFEWRHLTDQGWVAVDAGVHLEYAMDNLMRAMQLAQAQATSETDS